MVKSNLLLFGLSVGAYKGYQRYGKQSFGEMGELLQSHMQHIGFKARAEC
jgi:hypothetical protein